MCTLSITSSPQCVYIKLAEIKFNLVGSVLRVFESMYALFLCHYLSNWPSCSGVFGTGHAHLYPVVCLATSAASRSISGAVFEGICVKPKSLHAASLEQIHYAHQGTEKCKLRAKAAVFWCGINHDIDEMIESREPCQAHQVVNTKETLIPHDVPKHDWHTLATDLFHWNGTEY